MVKIKKSSFLQAVFISIILILSFSFWIRIYVVFLDKNIYHCYEDTEIYSIRIDFNETGIDVIDDKIKDLVTHEKNAFIDKARLIDEDSNTKYDFIMGSQTKKYNNIYFNHTVSHEFTGGNHYERKDYTLIYDTKNNKFLTIKDFIKEADLKKISLMSERLVFSDLKSKKKDIDRKIISEGTAPKYDNYKYFYLSEEGLSIVFVPYQVSSWSYGETTINLPWNKVEDYINSNYIGDKKKSTTIKIVPEKRDLSKYKGKKLVAFTFDDGPNDATTSILLNGVKKYDAKVTFFVLGSRVNYNKEVLKRAYKEGHDIGSHTYSHRDLRKLSDDSVLSEVDRTNKAIENVIGTEPVLIRPPYGSTNQHIRSLYMMNNILWSVDSLDWQSRNRKKIKKQILKTTHDGSIILLHDIYKESVYGALMAMEELQKKGYAFVTVSELADIRGITLNYDENYYELK